MDALRLDDAAFFFELGFPLGEFCEDVVDGLVCLRSGGDDVVALGVDGKARVLLLDGAEERGRSGRGGLDLVAEELDAEGVFVVGGVDLDDVAADAEGAAAEVDVVALVEDFDEAARDVLPFDSAGPSRGA